MARGTVFSLVLAGLVLCGPGIRPAAAVLDKPYDHSFLDECLKKFVNSQGEIDFRGLKEKPELLDRYLTQLASLNDPLWTKTWPREEILALWMNAYHAAILKALRDHYPVRFINDIPNVWEMDLIQVGPKYYSLRDIRRQQLLGSFRDEKIHFALSAGVKGGPKMPQEAFTGPRVEGQMFIAVTAFVNDPSEVKIEPGKKKVIRLSKIFEWYSADFVMDFGTGDNDLGMSESDYAIVSFVNHYLTDPEKARFLEDQKVKVKYLPFDWSLSEWHREAADGSGSPASN
ncbi:MAG: DUF547 domain-containing protein [Candidatus Omnitrophota bacterium]|jgi:hypothetical protein